ncbi:MAG TPA: sulfatase-like hydrolase/transferase, partial [Planctomycetaceae bacterium]|nr:sulfatase-like hydrolase/transferase [Planctomycetaceae bacterium]
MMTPHRLSSRLTVLAVVLVCCLFASTANAAEPARRPNVLFIFSDDHAAHAMSCYGSKINTTPNLDRIAREGMR